MALLPLQHMQSDRLWHTTCVQTTANPIWDQLKSFSTENFRKFLPNGDVIKQVCSKMHTLYARTTLHKKTKDNAKKIHVCSTLDPPPQNFREDLNKREGGEGEEREEREETKRVSEEGGKIP